MDRERLTRLLDEPSRVAREDLADLRAMAERFPWFSGAQLLLAVGEHAAGDVLFDEHLKVTAAHLPSRAVLFDGIHHKPEKPAATLTVVREGPSPTPVDRPAHPLHEPVTAPPPAAVIVEEPEVPPVAKEEDEEEAPVHHPVPPEETVPEPEQEARPTAPSSPAPDPLDRQIRQSAVAGHYDILRDLPSLPPAPPALASSPTVDAPLAEPPVPQAPVTMATRLRFTEWLELAGDEAAAPPPAPAAGTKEPGPAAAPASTGDIIDRFIQGTMPAPAKKAEFFTPQQAAKRSLEDGGLVSETLARIYEKQGNTAKAIETYQRLALKHPEKSAYFAALSKALEGGSNK